MALSKCPERNYKCPHYDSSCDTDGSSCMYVKDHDQSSYRTYLSFSSVATTRELHPGERAFANEIVERLGQAGIIVPPL